MIWERAQVLAWCDLSTQDNCARLSRRRCGWVLYAEVGDLNPLSTGTLHLNGRPVRLSCNVLACKRQYCAQGAVEMSEVERLVLFCLFLREVWNMSCIAASYTAAPCQAGEVSDNRAAQSVVAWQPTRHVLCL